MSDRDLDERNRPPADLQKLHSLMVFNLGYGVSRDDLYQHFGRFGEVADVYIPRNPRTMESRGFGFVRFYEKRDAEDALDMDGRKIDGREIGVQFAKYGRRDDGRSAGSSHSHRSPRRDRGRDRGRSSSRSPRRRRSISRSRSRNRSSKRRERSRSRENRYSRTRDRSGDRSGDRSRDRSPDRSRDRGGGGSRGDQSRDSDRSTSRSRKHRKEESSRSKSRSQDRGVGRASERGGEEGEGEGGRKMDIDMPDAPPVGGESNRASDSPSRDREETANGDHEAQ